MENSNLYEEHLPINLKWNYLKCRDLLLSLQIHLFWESIQYIYISWLAWHLAASEFLSLHQPPIQSGGTDSVCAHFSDPKIFLVAFMPHRLEDRFVNTGIYWFWWNWFISAENAAPSLKLTDKYLYYCSLRTPTSSIVAIFSFTVSFLHIWQLGLLTALCIYYTVRSTDGQGTGFDL